MFNQKYRLEANEEWFQQKLVDWNLRTTGAWILSFISGSVLLRFVTDIRDSWNQKRNSEKKLYPAFCPFTFDILFRVIRGYVNGTGAGFAKRKKMMIIPVLNSLVEFDWNHIYHLVRFNGSNINNYGLSWFSFSLGTKFTDPFLSINCFFFFHQPFTYFRILFQIKFSNNLWAIERERKGKK